MCSHNPRNKGLSYCAYCRVNQLSDDIKELIDRMESSDYTPTVQDLSHILYGKGS